MASMSKSKYPPLLPPLPSASPPTPIPESCPYDVFLSFRGADTRNNFTSHLYDRLVMVGIHTFLDDDELNPGGDISQQLMTAIEESRIYIVVFSNNYASSSWCLNELVKILHECNKNRGRVLLSVFFGVEPSQVRYQTGSFEDAFLNHQSKYINQMAMVNGWRAALTEAANLSGFDLQGSTLGSESRLINQIIKHVLSQVKPKQLFVAKHPVGLCSRVNAVYSLLRPESNNRVHLFGIWGMGGSGKTVIAKDIYNKILQSFDSGCFLANVREVSEQPNGLVYLQEQLISELLMRKKVKVGFVDKGIEMIRARLHKKRVLIVLDDLDNTSQAYALAGHRDWFGHGSVIIITTRDQHLLNQLEVDGRYEAKELNSQESLELFCLHSFNERFPHEYYDVTAKKIVAYSRGLPLALVVLGSYLFGRTIQEWNSAFEKLQRIPLNKIQQILKISYDGLDDDDQREIFLDIACFFTGMDIDYVIEILNGCDFNAEIGIRILRDRCLLTLNRNNELSMHDLLRDMGREIVRRSFPREPGKRTRLWSHQDATSVLMRNKGTDTIEGVSLVSPTKEEINLKTMSFARMSNLRLLQMAKVNFNGSFEHLSKEIRWIMWHECSLEHLPSSLLMENLVVLDMQHNRMSRFWQENQLLRHLKILNLSHSKGFTSTPDFTTVPSLVTLILEGCTSLLQIDPSIRCLNSLLVLNLKGCEKITNIPSEVYLLLLLGYLNISGCSNLKELPHNLGFTESLSELYADETAISELPPYFYMLENLTSLSLRGCSQMSAKPNALIVLGYSSLYGERLKTLRRLNLRDCNLSDDHISFDIGSLSALQELDLAGNNLSKLPLGFRKLINLESLWLDDWSILQSLPKLPSNLEALVAKNITALEGSDVSL